MINDVEIIRTLWKVDTDGNVVQVADNLAYTGITEFNGVVSSLGKARPRRGRFKEHDDVAAHRNGPMIAAPIFAGQ